MNRLLCSLVLTCSPALAGRPVWHDFDLKNLVALSHIVAVVERISISGGDWEKNCEPLVWELKVKELLSAKSTLPHSPGVKTYPAKNRVLDEGSVREFAKPGRTIRVVANETSMVDCKHRKKNPSGASFSAETFRPSDSKAADKGGPFLIFLKVESDTLYLTTNDAFDSISRRKEVEALHKSNK